MAAHPHQLKLQGIEPSGSMVIGKNPTSALRLYPRRLAEKAGDGSVPFVVAVVRARGRSTYRRGARHVLALHRTRFTRCALLAGSALRAGCPRRTAGARLTRGRFFTPRLVVTRLPVFARGRLRLGLL